MEDTTNLLDDFLWFEYDDSDKPFDFIGTDTETALICVPDEAVREKIIGELKSREFFITEAKSAKDAVKKMRFHTYTLLVIDENFDTANPDSNDLVRYLSNFNMATRRRMFIALLSQRLRTLDRRAALSARLRIIINMQSLKEFMTLITNGMAENEGFYYTFIDVMKESGKM